MYKLVLEYARKLVSIIESLGKIRFGLSWLKMLPTRRIKYIITRVQMNN